MLVEKISKLVVYGSMMTALLLSANQHGKPRRGRTNFWVNLAIIATNAMALVAGGFFNAIF